MPHPLRFLQRVGYATVGIEIRGIPPFAKNAKDGAPGDLLHFRPRTRNAPFHAPWVDNATNLDRKSSVPGPIMISSNAFPEGRNRAQFRAAGANVEATSVYFLVSQLRDDTICPKAFQGLLVQFYAQTRLMR